jgi:hypothetical protein
VAEVTQRIRYNYGTTGGEISGEKATLSKAFGIFAFFVIRQTLNEKGAQGPLAAKIGRAALE